MFLQGTGKFIGPGHVGILSTNGVQSFSHHYYDANQYAPQYDAYGAPNFNFVPLSWTADDWPYFTNDWSADYTFQGDARDQNGQYSGLLQGGATIQPDPTYGHVLNLNGTNEYVWLPPGVAYGETFIAVVNWRGGNAWQRIFDFGYDTTRTVMMTPASSDNVLRCDINPGGSLQTMQWTRPLPTNVWTQVAVTLDGTQGILYVDGQPVVTNTSMYYIPLNVAPQTNALGKSKFTADPYFNGQYANFRSYGRALSPGEIIAPLPAISEPVDGSTCQPGDVITFSGSAMDFLARPLAATNLTWQVLYAQNGSTNVVAGPYAGVSDGMFAIPLRPVGGGNYIFNLTANDGAGHQSSVSSTLFAAHPPAGWSSYYPFRSDAHDVNGNYDGILQGGASFVNDPTRGNVLNLSGTNQYVSFPSGLSGMQTFMAWVKWNGGAAWQRIYDFGNDTNRYSVLTPEAADGNLRFNISIDSIPGEQVVEAPFTLPTGVWVQVAVVITGNNVVMFTNGVPVATNLFANLVPANLEATNIYFGKSQWPADPYFSGCLSSVRVFSTALAPNQITAPQITILQPALGSVYIPGSTISFAGSANDFYDNAIPATGLDWTVSFINAGSTNVVFGLGQGIASGTFGIPATGSGATNGFYQITLVAVDSAGRMATNSVNIYPQRAGQPLAWSSHYPFTNGFQDVNGSYNGTPKNGASIQNDVSRGNVMNLTGIADQYLNLPAGVNGAETISSWINWSGSGSWVRIFDFGLNTNQFFYLTPSDQNNLPQVAITADLPVYNQVFESPVAISPNTWTHVAVVMNGREGILYLNGQAVAVNNSVNLLPSDLGATNCNFGKSQFPADAYFNGRFSQATLNSSAEPVAAILAPAAAIIQPVTNTLFTGGETVDFVATGSDYSGKSLAAGSYMWSAEFHSNGVVYPALGSLIGTTSGSFAVPTNAPSTTNIFYRILLSVTDTNGYSQSTSVDLPPYLSLASFDTVPSGLQLTLDGNFLNTPTNQTLVAGYVHTLSAPSPQNLAGSNYSFVLWSDGGSQSHSVTISTNGNSLVASYIYPSLSLNQSGSLLSLSWPGWASPLTLFSTTNLSPPVSWVLVTNVPASFDGVSTIQLPVAGQNTFFRLGSQ